MRNNSFNKYLLSPVVFIVAMLVLLEYSCSNEQQISAHGNTPVSVTFTLANTRSKAQSEVEGDETQIQEMLLLLFRSEKLVQIQPITTLQPGDGMANNYKFNVLVLSTSRPLRFVFLANTGWQSSQLEELMGKTYSEVIAALPPFQPEMNATGVQNPFPMWGELVREQGVPPATDEEPTIMANIRLMRAVAKVEITKAPALTEQVFRLTSVRLFRCRDMSVVPLLENMSENISEFQVVKPTLPPNPDMASIPTVIESSTLPIRMYAPESKGIAVTEPGWATATTVIVVGGFFNAMQQETYYRIDFIKNGPAEGGAQQVSYGEILRNHHYLFNITEVKSAGCYTPEDAAENATCGISLKVAGWIDRPCDFPDVGAGSGGILKVAPWITASSEQYIGSGWSLAVPWTEGGYNPDVGDAE